MEGLVDPEILYSNTGMHMHNAHAMHLLYFSISFPGEYGERNQLRIPLMPLGR